jgi:membrane-bound ClpP family serine protease
MTGRLILAIISTTIEEVVLAVIALFILPQFNFSIPIIFLAIIMALWLILSIFLYRAGSRALRREPVLKLPVIGSKGKVVSPLIPDGLVRIEGELWIAEAPKKKKLDVNVEVIVLEQNGLKLIVRKIASTDVNEEE